MVNIWIKKRSISTFEELTKKYYDAYDEKIKIINDSENLNKKEEIINIQYDATLELPIAEYNL